MQRTVVENVVTSVVEPLLIPMEAVALGDVVIQDGSNLVLLVWWLNRRFECVCWINAFYRFGDLPLKWINY